MLSPGEGKSALGCLLACDLGRKTLVVCPDRKLISQWEGAIKKWAPKATVGVVCGSWDEKKHPEQAERDFILTTDESASRCSLPVAFFQSFGTAIIDEAHHIASKSLSQILPRLPCKHIIGLSATPSRPDGLEHALYWLMGPCVVRYLRVPEVTLKVNTINIRLLSYDGSAKSVIRTRSGDMVWHRTMANVANDFKRNRMLHDLVRGLVRKHDRAKVIVISTLRDHVTRMRDNLLQSKAFAENEVQILMGGDAKTAAMEHAKSAEVRVLLGTMQFLDEGFDDPRLDTIVMVMPRSAKAGKKVQTRGASLVQRIGRVERVLEGKKKPLVIDVVDTGVQAFQNMAMGRARTYRDHGWIIRKWKEPSSAKSV